MEMGIRIRIYLLRVLSLLPYQGKTPSNAELDKPLPWHPKVLVSLNRTDNVI